MKHYTEEIPTEIAELLRDAGMPIKIKTETWRNGKYSFTVYTTYADVLDWFIQKELPIMLFVIHNHLWKAFIYNEMISIPYKETFAEAANAAIEFALVFLKEAEQQNGE